MIYLSGPMSGLPDHNKPAFHAAAAHLRSLGHFVLSPAELSFTGRPYLDCLKDDIRLLTACSQIVLLPGWEKSRGANLELQVAQGLELVISNYCPKFGIRS